MADPLPFNFSSSESLDARLRVMLRELPREHAVLLEALLQERDLLVSVAERRAERVQRLHEASSSLMRTLDREELELEVARQLLRLLPVDGVAVARPPQALGESPELCVHLTPEGLAPLVDAERLVPALAEVVRTGRSVRLAGGTNVAGALVAVPIMQGFRLVGVIGAYSRYATTIGDEDLDATQTLAAHAATALLNSGLYAQSERERRQSDALASLAQALGSASRLPDVLRLALRHAIALFLVEGADIALRRDDFLQIVSAEGCARPLQGMFLPIGASVSGRSVRERRPIIVNDIAADPDTFEPTRRLAGVSRSIVAPLVAAGDALGVLSLVNRARPFDAEDERMLQQFASQVAVAIVNARLYEEAADAQREISAAFEAIGDGIVVLDADARIVRSNARFLEITGLPSADGARGREFYDAVLHEPRALTGECAVGQAILEGRTARAQLRSAWNGRVLDILAAPHPAGGAVVSVSDVTATRLLHDRHRVVVDNTTDAILCTSAEGDVEFANPAARRLFGASVTLEGERLDALVPASEAAMWVEAMACSRRGEAARLDGTVTRGEGERRRVSVRLAPLIDEGHVSQLVISLRDVTEEREQAAALLRAEARYTRLVEAAEDAIVCVDEQGNLTAVNRAIESVMGRSREALLGRHFMEIVDEEERPALQEAYSAALAGHRRRQTIRFTRSGGARGFATLILAPTVEDGRITGVLAIARDVTEERLLVDQAMRRDRLVAMGELVGGVAHEVNSPLTSILAYAQVLERGVGGEDAARALDTITREAKRASSIVGKLLAFARQGQPERQATDVNQALRDTIELRRHPLRMQEIVLAVSLVEDPPMVQADPFQLQQVFINLLSNAEQAVAQQPGERRISVASEVRGDAFVATISDNGPGIAAEALPHIFNPFFTTKPRGAGTGLGLSISDGIIREHRGVLRVRSEPGQGATFEVELPLSPAAN